MRTLFALLGIVATLTVLPPPRAHAEGRTITGTVVRIDPDAGTFTVKDAAGSAWNYKVEPDAGIDLGAFRVGDRVSVTARRATPANMITAADLLRKGDRVERAGF